MHTLAILFGFLGVIGYFFYWTVAKSSRGDDGQGVNKPIINKFEPTEPCAADQRGRWD